MTFSPKRHGHKPFRGVRTHPSMSGHSKLKRSADTRRLMELSTTGLALNYKAGVTLLREPVV